MIFVQSYYYFYCSNCHFNRQFLIHKLYSIMLLLVGNLHANVSVVRCNVQKSLIVIVICKYFT